MLYLVENPAIIVAHCLRIVYNVPFTDSTIYSVPSAGLERFNVYGTVRSLTKSFDQWYPDGKAKVREYYQQQSQRTGSLQYGLAG